MMPAKNNLRNLPPNLKIMRLLFKEVLQGMPEPEAERLITGYRAGKNICLILGPSSYGPAEKQTAFGWFLDDKQDWRKLPEAIGGVQ